MTVYLLHVIIWRLRGYQLQVSVPQGSARWGEEGEAKLHTVGDMQLCCAVQSSLNTLAEWSPPPNTDRVPVHN